jgi:hypothetical protein
MDWELIAVGVAVVIGLPLAFWSERRRRRALEAVAGTLGMTFRRRDSTLSLPPFSLLGKRFRGFKLLGRIDNVFRGEMDGREVALFRCWSHRNMSRHGTTQTVAAFRLAGQHLPQFLMRPETVIKRIGAKIGMQDIDIPTSPEFSRSYVLKGSDETGIRLLFQGRVLDFFAMESGWSVEGNGDWLLVYREDELVAPEDFPEFLRESSLIADTFAKH